MPTEEMDALRKAIAAFGNSDQLIDRVVEQATQMSSALGFAATQMPDTITMAAKMAAEVNRTYLDQLSPVLDAIQVQQQSIAEQVGQVDQTLKDALAWQNQILHDQAVANAAFTGDDLRALREQMNLTQAEIAAQIGVAANTWSRWEQDKMVATRHAKEIAELFRRL